MKVLALTSSSTQASVALSEGSQSLQKIHAVPRGHSEFMNTAIDQLLQEAGWSLSDLHLIALDHGPGSFTGIRVAVSIARSLCYLLKKPCFSTSSLEILAAQTRSQEPGATILCGMNAYKNLIFFEAFGPSSPLAPAEALSPAQIEERAQTLTSPWVWSGNGLSVYQTLFTSDFQKKVRMTSPLIEHPDASILARLALASSPSTWIQDWKFIVPLYLRDSAAEENLRIRS